jgi:hypothetical protein
MSIRTAMSNGDSEPPGVRWGCAAARVRRRTMLGDLDLYAACAAWVSKHRRDSRAEYFQLSRAQRLTNERSASAQGPSKPVLGRERWPVVGPVAAPRTNGHEEVSVADSDGNGRGRLVTSIATVIHRGRSSEIPCEPFHRC